MLATLKGLCTFGATEHDLLPKLEAFLRSSPVFAQDDNLAWIAATNTLAAFGGDPGLTRAIVHTARLRPHRINELDKLIERAGRKYDCRF